MWARKFWLPKAGNCPDEYEDAFRVVYPHRIGVSGRGLVRVAISDGASESAFAREWAKILTGAFVARPPDLRGLTEDSLLDWLASAQEEWRACVPWDRIPWHGEAKARAGAFATLLGLTIGNAPDNSRRLSWQAVAVGDRSAFLSSATIGCGCPFPWNTPPSSITVPPSCAATRPTQGSCGKRYADTAGSVRRGIFSSWHPTPWPAGSWPTELWGRSPGKPSLRWTRRNGMPGSRSSGAEG